MSVWGSAAIEAVSEAREFELTSAPSIPSDFVLSLPFLSEGEESATDDAKNDDADGDDDDVDDDVVDDDDDDDDNGDDDDDDDK